ncbi:MAG: ERAP1-like C-terminal domain-containing protein, partial [Chloroflexota bacterium]|nr:ERAP1-like C-terminal domain-containing protein [Chloroflexota bacterium]
DHAYALATLDPISAEYARNRIDRIGDPLLRTLTWLALWEMVRDSRLASTDYVGLAVRHLVAEPDMEILSAMLPTVQGTLAAYVPEARRVDAAGSVYRAGRELLGREERERDLRIVWARTIIGIAGREEDVRDVAGLVDGDDVASSVIDQEMRWAIAVRAAAFGLPDADARLAAERARDPSDRAERAARRAEAAKPNPETKRDVWERLVRDGYPSLQLAVDAMQGFNWAHQRDVLGPFVERYFASVAGVFETADQRYAVAFARHLFPTYRVEPAILRRSEELVTELGDRLPTLTRVLREANDDLARAIACRAYAEATA